MPAESAEDRLAFFDLDEFGSEVTVDGNSIQGLLEQPYIGIDIGEGPVMSGAAPVLWCRTEDVASVAIGDTIYIGTPYKVVEIRPDGDGMTALVLHDA